MGPRVVYQPSEERILLSRCASVVDGTHLDIIPSPRGAFGKSDGSMPDFGRLVRWVSALCCAAAAVNLSMRSTWVVLNSTMKISNHHPLNGQSSSSVSSSCGTPPRRTSRHSALVVSISSSSRREERSWCNLTTDPTCGKVGCGRAGRSKMWGNAA